MLEPRDVRGHSAENPKAIYRKGFPSIGRPDEPALFTGFALEAEPTILVARRDMRSPSRRIYATVRTSPAVTPGIGCCGPCVFASAIHLPPFARGRTYEPDVPSLPFWISEISEAHSRPPTAMTETGRKAKSLPDLTLLQHKFAMNFLRLSYVSHEPF